MKDDSFRDFVLDQLRGLGPLESRRMFGSYGLYQNGVFFGIIRQGQLFLKTSAATREEYVRRGMQAFRPSARQTSTSYYEVPAAILEDDEQLVEWARQAIESQLAGD